MEGLTPMDRALFLLLNSFHFKFLDAVMVILSGQGVWVPFIGYFLWLSYRHLGKKQTAMFALFLAMAIIASDSTSSYVIKNLVHRLRPCREMDLKPLIYSFGQKCGGKFGFVSSHAANAFAIVFFSVWTLRIRNPWATVFMVIPLIVSYSRVYLGVHYPGDIIGGAMVGVFWSWFFSWCYLRLRGLSGAASN